MPIEPRLIEINVRDYTNIARVITTPAQADRPVKTAPHVTSIITIVGDHARSVAKLVNS